MLQQWRTCATRLSLWDVKLFDVPHPLYTHTLTCPLYLWAWPHSSFLLHSFKGHSSLWASPGPFLPALTPSSLWTKGGEWLRCSVARCSPLLPQALIAAALRVQLPSPASHCVIPLFGLPPPRWFIGHTGETLLERNRGVCAYVCVRIEYACLGETGCCRHSPCPFQAPPLVCVQLWKARVPIGGGAEPPQPGKWQTLLIHLFGHSLSNLPASVEEEKKNYSSGGLSKSRGPAEASSDADVLATLWHFCLSRIYIYRKWPKPCVFPHCLFMLNSLVSWLILQLTSENVSKCHILAAFLAWLHPAQINLNQTFRNKANKFCCCI